MATAITNTIIPDLFANTIPQKKTRKRKSSGKTVNTRLNEVIYGQRPYLQVYSNTLQRSICFVNEGLMNPDELATYLRVLGDKHRDVYVVESQDFFMFKRALLDTFAEFLAESWTEEMKDAWAKAFDKVSASMRDKG